MLRFVGLAGALALGAAMLTVPTTLAASAPSSQPKVPVIDWRSCDGEVQCARVAVPLDYDDPAGATTTLNLLKVPAANPARRIGTLFVNPGGPGGTSTDFAQFFPQLMRPAVHNRFDIVGIDPRGTSRPQTICRTDQPEPPFGTGSFPVTKKAIAGWIRHDNWQSSACRTGANPITSHLSTADTARDMDLIRQAVGDDKLTYYGISYGSYLGETYAALFPDNVRAMIIDGVIDPVAWATGRGGVGSTIPFSTRIRSGEGAAEALTSALRRCDELSKARCALSGSATRTWNQLVTRLRKGPERVDGFRLTYSDLVGGTLGYLYSGPSYPQLMRDLKHIHAEIFGAEKSHPTTGRRTLTVPADDRGVVGPWGFGASSDSFHAIACADTENPRDPQVWARVANNFETKQPWFGRLWTWASSTCARWPLATGADSYRGPFKVTPSAPVLVIGNSHDPATPISGARAATALLGGSRLLESRSWGHGAIGTGSCVSGAMRDYLISLALPSVGATCLPNQELFPAH